MGAYDVRMARGSGRPTYLDIQGVLDVLDDAREALNDLNSPLIPPTPRHVRRRVHEVLNAVATARYAMDAITKSRLRQSEGAARAEEFEAWKKRRRREIDTDPLVVWFDNARDDFVHRAMSPLKFSFLLTELNTADFYPPRWIRGDQVQMNNDGIWWVDDAGSPEERREPLDPLPGTLATSQFYARFAPIPASWPDSLKRLTPAQVCQRALAYYRAALRDYYDQWWPEREPTGMIG